MTALLQMPDIIRALVLPLYFALFIALLFLLILRMTRLRRIRACPVCVLFLLITAFIIIYLLERQRYIGAGSTPSAAEYYMGGLPWVFHALVLTGAALYSCIGFLKEREIAGTEITPDSIREALDNLPSGLCFSAHNGLTLLTNRRMYDLALDVDGNFLQNAEVLWQNIAAFERKDGVEKIQNSTSPMFRRPDGSVWQFSKTQLPISGRQYVQTMAANITSLHKVSEELAESNATLEQQQRRLKKLIEGMIEITREEEILAVKVHIHNELGRCVLAGRRGLKDPIGEGVTQALALWGEVANQLEISAAETTPNAGETLQHLTELAALLGCAIEIDGNLPKNEEIAYLLLTAVREAVTNAVRHAGASRVTVKLKQNNGTFCAQIADNGGYCPPQITEGSGLTSLRSRIRQAGGELNILCEGGVSLHLQLPLSREED